MVRTFNSIMRQLFSIAICLCFLSCGFSALTESTNASTNENPSPLTETVKPSENPNEKTRTAGSLEDVDELRTHSIRKRLLQKLEDIAAKLKSSSSILAPILGTATPAPIAQAQVIPGYPPSCGGYGGYSSKCSPIGSLFSNPVPQPIPGFAPTAVLPLATLPSIPQTVYSKPPSTLQEVIHEPTYTEIVVEIRKPVITEVEEYIHKPVPTELQQVIKKPDYTQHVLKTPSYNSVNQDVYQAPLHLKEDSIHVLDKPVSQFVQLPTEFVQQASPQIVQTPSGIFGGYSSGHGIGSSSGYYPSPVSGYNPALSDISSGESVHQYLVPPSCRTTGNCFRQAESTERSIIIGNTANLPALLPHAMYSTSKDCNSPMPWNSIFAGSPIYISEPVFSPLSDLPLTNQKKSKSEAEDIAQSTEQSNQADNSAKKLYDIMKNDPEAANEFILFKQRVLSKYVAKKTPSM